MPVMPLPSSSQNHDDIVLIEDDALPTTTNVLLCVKITKYALVLQNDCRTTKNKHNADDDDDGRIMLYNMTVLKIFLLWCT